MKIKYLKAAALFTGPKNTTRGYLTGKVHIVQHGDRVLVISTNLHCMFVHIEAAPHRLGGPITIKPDEIKILKGDSITYDHRYFQNEGTDSTKLLERCISFLKRAKENKPAHICDYSHEYLGAVAKANKLLDGPGWVEVHRGAKGAPGISQIEPGETFVFIMPLNPSGGELEIPTL